MRKFTSTAITFVLLLATTSIATAQAGKFATIKGQFLYGEDGVALPNQAKIQPTKDQEVCGKVQLFEEKLVVNKENRGIANIVIWAYKPKKAALHPSYAKSAKDTIKMDNIGCRFEPNTVAVRVGQTLEVGNLDPVGHNSMISFIKNKGVNPLIPANQKVQFGPKEIKKAEIVPSKVSCSIHPWMQGYVIVQDHPYMAVTDKDGKFEIKNMPVGKYTLKVWNGKYIQDVKVDGKKAKWSKGKYVLNLKKDEEHKYTVDPKNFK